MKLGDELSEELNFRNSDCDPKGNYKSESQVTNAKRFELIAKWLTVTCEGKKISALKLNRFVNSIPMLIVNQQGTGIICRKIFFATSKLIECDQIVEHDQFSVAND